jgi:hypothetical protein
MPRATQIRGQPVRAVAGQRQARHQAQVQAAAVPAIVEGAVDEIAEDLGTSISTIQDALVTVDTRLYNLENPIP